MRVSPGKKSIADARSPVPRLVGQAVRYPNFFIEREVHGARKGIVQFGYFDVRTAEIQPARDVLFAQVILFVDHDGNFIGRALAEKVGIPFIDERRAVLFIGRELFTDKMIVAQRERHPVGDLVHIIELEVPQPSRRPGDDANDLLRLFCVLQPVRKRIIGKIARKAYARGNDGAFDVIHLLHPRNRRSTSCLCRAGRG